MEQVRDLFGEAVRNHQNNVLDAPTAERIRHEVAVGLERLVQNREIVSGSVSECAYDREHGLLRVNVTVVPVAALERVVISFHIQ